MPTYKFEIKKGFEKQDGTANIKYSVKIIYLGSLLGMIRCIHKIANTF